MNHTQQTQGGVQERTSMKQKNDNRATQQSGRPNPSRNSINPNRGLNEDEQKRKVNETEQDETTNAYRDTDYEKNDESSGSGNSGSHKQAESLKKDSSKRK